MSTRCWYTLCGVQLLSGVIQAAAGEPQDAYVQRKLFAPLGITGASWRKELSMGLDNRLWNAAQVMAVAGQ